MLRGRAKASSIVGVARRTSFFFFLRSSGPDARRARGVLSRKKNSPSGDSHYTTTFARGSGRLLFFGRETGTKFQRVYIASSIFFGKGAEFGVKRSTITLTGKFVCIVTFYTAMMM